MISTKQNWWWPQVCNEFKNLKKKTPKESKSWNLRPKLYLAIFFWVTLLIISFKDLILAFYNSVLNTTIKVNIRKKINLVNMLSLLLGV